MKNSRGFECSNDATLLGGHKFHNLYLQPLKNNGYICLML